jgi:SRSO17 transposase
MEIAQGFKEMMKYVGNPFSSILGYQNAEKYIKALIGPAERKNGWQMAEYSGDKTPYAIQQFIYRGRYSSDELRDGMKKYVSDKLGEEDGVLVVDETGFLKQGKKSCGVKRQYSGTAGRIENCQIGVFLTYSSSKGHTPLDRRLYMPEDWMKDGERLKGAGVPEELTFQTKPQMAFEMIRKATESGVPYAWVTGDCVYGDYRDIRMWLENNRKCYVMNVSGKEYVWQGCKQNSISRILKNLPDEGWFEASCGDGSKGARVYDWLTVEINPPPMKGYYRTLLIRRSKTAPDDMRAYVCFAPVNVPIQKLITVAGTRWTVETCFKESKSLVGLDQYEVRSYDGWYKHITFACIALALLTVLSSNSNDTLSIQQHNPSGKSLDEFKKGRNLRV